MDRSFWNGYKFFYLLLKFLEGKRLDEVIVASRFNTGLEIGLPKKGGLSPPFTTKDSKQCLCQEVLSIFDEGEGNLAKIDKNSRKVFADAQKRQRFTADL